MTISQVAWAINPNTTANNRPAQLVRQLQELGAISEHIDTWFHGRAKGGKHHHQALFFMPGASISMRDQLAILSPVFLANTRKQAAWVDLYDDWSIAPDIRIAYKLLAAAGYRGISNSSTYTRTPVTVNSPYMKRKLGRNKVEVVPNGVNPSLSELGHLGNDKNRLIVLGHFFRGRTDFALLERVASMPLFEEIIIGGPGKDPATLRLIDKLRHRYPTKVVVKQWIDPVELANVTGSRTVALIPHVVSDYTLSQDAMKAYTFMALGIPTICPAPLWPQPIDREHVFFAGHGDRMEDTLGSWLSKNRPTNQWRADFAIHNSWKRRAETIAEMLN